MKDIMGEDKQRNVTLIASRILTGLTRTEARARYGNEQVQIWRRSFTGKPPDMPEDLAFMWQIPYENFPRSESLEDVSKRAPVYFQNEIRPALERGENVLVVSHGAPIRSILMELKSLTLGSTNAP